MTKADLISAVACEIGYPQVTVRQVLNTTASLVAAALARGGEAVLPELGKLKPVTRAARVARNPKTGAEVQVPAKAGVKFLAKKALRERLAGDVGAA